MRDSHITTQHSADAGDTARVAPQPRPHSPHRRPELQHAEVAAVRAGTSEAAFEVEVALHRVVNDEVVATQRVLVPVHGPSLYGNYDLRFRLETPTVKA